ncbi:unnamed protein product [Leptidea sinapis]|uniref:Uncharacterized protein n=1 Tax=Leptidea sinapis TaxID=189913 RepID=A0A5E4Q4P3_9NEOP|nr:unnamed protein product [Leptidea sinapis]
MTIISTARLKRLIMDDSKNNEPLFFCYKICPLYCSPRRDDKAIAATRCGELATLGLVNSLTNNKIREESIPAKLKKVDKELKDGQEISENNKICTDAKDTENNPNFGLSKLNFTTKTLKE